MEVEVTVTHLCNHQNFLPCFLIKLIEAVTAYIAEHVAKVV